jgi:hypothetical protein
MNLGVVYRPKHFKSVAKMKLDDVMAKFTHDEYYKGQEIVEILNEDSIKCEDSVYLPGTMKPAFDTILASGLPIENIYTFISRKAGAETYGRHKDAESVMLVQAIGKMMYRFDDGTSCVIEPGDSLFIPSGVYHEPRAIMGPRVTLSCKMN